MQDDHEPLSDGEAFSRVLDEMAPPSAASDQDLAEVFVRAHGHDWRYVNPWKAWMEWNGSRWEKDEQLRVQFVVSAALRHYVNFGPGSELAEAQKKDLNSSKALARVASMCTNRPLLRATVDQWDRDPWVINTPTGVISLKDGTQCQHAREQYCAKSTAVSPGGDCPLWMSHLDRITGSDLDLQAYLQRAAGYSLTGDTSEHVFFFCFGAGGNGKSVFLDTLSAIMGRYATPASIEMFIRSYNDKPSHEVADLQGARLVFVNEVKKGRAFDESRLNSLTSSKIVKAHRKYEASFEFQPRFKLWFAGNEKPEISGGVDEAMRRRVHIIPFLYTIKEEDRIKNFTELLVAEYPGILRWMIEGCLAWQRIGLEKAEAVQRATDDYLNTEDAFTCWINECCVLSPPASARLLDVYENYKLHCKSVDETPVKRSKMIDALLGHGVTVISDWGLKHLQGIRLIA